ncbi:MAG: hypothetical protein KKD18_00820 [Nanoarchaeota archaeon]|nr:hypothetical protein [Nanoarchaeota archaeon]
MKEEISYCVEYKRKDERRYLPRSSWGFEDKELALRIAKMAASEIINARVIEQRRRIIKVFTKEITRAKYEALIAQGFIKAETLELSKKIFD